ncbi:isoaspartyl peptidase/L-asparaginase family protein [Deinococcus yavapaiensis]|nr:isoaspartyl peptidase/L-asparaginase family protein [Deinococcus yavapaiensis]
MKTWGIILHGGAGNIADEWKDRAREGCLAALEAGRTILLSGGSALDAAEAAVRALEDDDAFNAGYGSVLNTDGDAEMDAAVMDGETLNIGAVGAVMGVRHPVSVARLMLTERPTLLVAGGARRFAEAKGAELCDPAEMVAPRRKESFERDVQANAHDTVGCVALDMNGHVAVATSTGGLSGKMPGRVGDAPLPGCGFLADDQIGGLAFSGHGEFISRTALAARLLTNIPVMGPQRACDEATKYMTSRVGGEVGGIVLDKSGRVGWSHESRDFAVAFATSRDPEPKAYMTKSEEAS